jgi:hypothetical protein
MARISKKIETIYKKLSLKKNAKGKEKRQSAS